MDLLLNRRERRSGGCDLGDDVNAVAVLLDHASETAHLTLDATEALYARGLFLRMHG